MNAILNLSLLGLVTLFAYSPILAIASGYLGFTTWQVSGMIIAAYLAIFAGVVIYLRAFPDETPE